MDWIVSSGGGPSCRFLKCHRAWAAQVVQPASHLADLRVRHHLHGERSQARLHGEPATPCRYCTARPPWQPLPAPIAVRTAPAAQTQDDWASNTVSCVIPGSVDASSSANFPSNLVCDGRVVTADLTTPSPELRKYGTLYVFKDYADTLYTTVVLDGAANDTADVPFITLPNEVTGGMGVSQLFAWPDLNLEAFSSSINYPDQAPYGRCVCKGAGGEGGMPRRASVYEGRAVHSPVDATRAQGTPVGHCKQHHSRVAG